ncbi:hypothetical protein PR202_gb20820 [Eleusine coracana subsp. coracana]|uniref:F-box domain-containing protein n=1 Tax=Eleusine coracana subsp. coracana TaxID=191504 RepID=A0AAV5FBL6_ELECO|nr:hypothetical protein PR202_gb20820 [Eleusine coracana subsp. coracana]
MAAVGACDRCREDQLYLECCSGGILLGSARPGAHIPDGDEDRISALPDDMLLQVLSRLRWARAAAHTGLLARRWRGIWAAFPSSSSTVPDRICSTPRSPRSPAPRRRSSRSTSPATTVSNRRASPRCSTPPRLWRRWISWSTYIHATRAMPSSCPALTAPLLSSWRCLASDSHYHPQEDSRRLRAST